MRDEDLGEILTLPVGVIGGMHHRTNDKRKLVEAVSAHVIPGRSSAQKLLIVVVIIVGCDLARPALHGLHMDVAKHDVAESSIVKPVIALPGINQGTAWNRGLERRMGIYEGFCRRESLIRASNHPDPTVGFRYMLYEPVNGVPSVCRVIDGRGIQRPMHGAGHHIIAFRTVLTAYVLPYPNVPCLNKVLI